MNIKNNFIKTIGFTILVACLFLLFASKSSPIYPLNDWVDANAIFTVGKSMMDGKVVYKDIFEEDNKSFMSFKLLLLNGVLAGSVIWIKYSMIGFWFGWMLVVLFTLLIDKKILRALQASVVFLLGMVLSGIPWLLYFYSVDGLTNFIDVYFITNIKYYASSNGMLMNLVTITGKIILVYFRHNPGFGILFLGGLIGYLMTKKVESNILVKLGIVVPFLFLFLSVYGGGIRLDYYFQIFTPFIFLGILFALKLLPGKLLSRIQSKAHYLTIGTIAIFCVIMNFMHHNAYMRDYKKADLFQYQFADYIKDYTKPTLLNYMFLDMGVYNTANIEPTTFYYMKHNFDYGVYPFDVDALNSYVRNKDIDFVVLRTKVDKPYSNKILEANYTLVMEKNQYYEEEIHRFMLYKLNDLNK